jgi:hypothetical protein
MGMELQELEIVINENGETTIRVRGVHGAECRDVTKELEEQLGTLRERELTGEYYESRHEEERTRLMRG